MDDIYQTYQGNLEKLLAGRQPKKRFAFFGNFPGCRTFVLSRASQAREKAARP